ncbi:DNA cytosine methyltransferase, partial [Luteolibacter marinus]
TPYDAIMLEQVPAVLPVWVAIGQALNEIGYEVATGVLNAEEYGVPQTRRRAILVARRDRAPALPRPTHKRFRKLDLAPDDLHGLLPYKTMGKVLQRGEEFTVISNYGSGGDPKARGRRGS